jgi:hypothetical protein
MDVREWMAVGIPTAEAQIEAANAGKVVVNHDDL